MDYQLHRPARKCAATGRELADGETVYSTLVDEGGQLVRQDFAAEAWSGPPPGALGWWKARIATRESKAHHMAPRETLVELFQSLANDPAQQELRYVLTLLLLRRRVLRLEESAEGAPAGTMTVYSHDLDETFEVREAMPDEARAAEIEQRLAALLHRV
jgi:hypothetical protein